MISLGSPRRPGMNPRQPGMLLAGISGETMDSGQEHAGTTNWSPRPTLGTTAGAGSA